MNYKNFWKTTLSFGLLITLLLPSVALANAKTNTLPIGLNLANNEEATLEKYSQLATTYLNDCEDLARQGSPQQARPSDKELKRCLTIARELRGKFAEFTLALGTLEKKIKGAKKWTKEVDEQFLKEAGKFGVTAETAGEMRRAGGFRNFYESSIKELKLSKGELDSEVKELENKLSSEGQIFQTVSFSPSAEYGKVVKIKKIIKMVLAVINAVTAFCESTGACS